MTAVLVTHDRDDVFEVVDRVAVMDDGKVAQLGAPSEVYRHPETPSVARALGPCSVMPAATASGFGLDVDRPFGFRPEAVQLHADPDGGAEVREVRFGGPVQVVQLVMGNCEFAAHLAATASPPAPGRRYRPTLIEYVLF